MHDERGGANDPQTCCAQQSMRRGGALQLRIAHPTQDCPIANILAYVDVLRRFISTHSCQGSKQQHAPRAQ